VTKRDSIHAFPLAPVDLVAVAVSGCEVILAWTECGNRTFGFHIERAGGAGIPGMFSEIGKTVSHVAVFRDGGVTGGKTYQYRVRAWNDSGDSLSSNVSEVTTPRDDSGRDVNTD
jgi:hypothetical protein